MTNKERYASIGTWVKIFREEGVEVSDRTIRNRLEAAEVIGITARNQVGRVLREGFYSEIDVRRACRDILNAPDPLDITYFQDSTKLKADLFAFAQELGEGKTLLDLSTHNISSLSITCQNGQLMKGATYLRTAAKALGFAETTKEAASKLAYILKHLLKTAGFDIFDETYFRDPVKIRADLSAFAQELGSGKTPPDLNTGNISSLSITCQNGQLMKGATYLKTAAKALGFAETTKEASSKGAYILKILKEIAGFTSQSLNQPAP